MVSFRQFLEAAVSAEPNFQPLDAEKAFRMAIENCRDAESWILNNKPLWRSMSGGVSKTGCAVVDTSATERKSENTTNYYTMILDNNPYCEEFPKRSRSFICSTSRYRAEAFSGELFALLPFDKVKMGVVHDTDMWDVNIELFGKVRAIDTFNSYFRHMDLEPTLESFEHFDKMLKQEEPNDEKAAFETEFHLFGEKAKLHEREFLHSVWEAYSPKNTGFSIATTKSAELPKDSEIWVGGKCMIFSAERWEEFRRLAKDGNI